MNPPKLNIACVETLLTEDDLQLLSHRHLPQVFMAHMQIRFDGIRHKFSMMVVGKPDETSMRKLAHMALKYAHEVLLSKPTYDNPVHYSTFLREYMRNDEEKAYMAQNLLWRALPGVGTPIDKNAFDELVAFIIERNAIKLVQINEEYIVNGAIRNAPI